MESKAHIDLVKRIIAYVKEIIPESDFDLIQCDSDGSNCEVRVLGDFIPDVYYRNSEQLIIGEAKTLNDFERVHSREQFTAYLSEFQLFGGESKLIIAVPWQLTVTAKNYFKRIKREKGLKVTVIVINETGKELII